MNDIAILFARTDSVYKLIPGCDVWDAERNSLNWPGGNAVVAHPPCRAWGRLRHFANIQPGEKELAIWAVSQVRKWGGVLEHPYKSTLWAAPEVPLPCPGRIDAFGGWTLALPQFWFGHAAEKATWFYIVGVKPGELPPIPLVLGEAEFVVQTRKRIGFRKHIPKADRERTPMSAAEWLVKVARIAALRPAASSQQLGASS
jgi:hypothetical protein